MKSPSRIRHIRNAAVVLGFVIVMLAQQRPQHLHYGTTTLAFVPPPLLLSLLQQPPKQQQRQQHQQHDRSTGLFASKPQRLHDNADGVVYVNDRCINCAACAGFASQIFRPSNEHNAHIVYEQPASISDIAMTRAALAACPVAAIRIESFAERNHRHQILLRREEEPVTLTLTKWTDHDAWTIQNMTSKEMKRPFPRPFLLNEANGADHTSFSSTVPDVYWIGHHNEASFGAISYLVRAEFENQPVWIMVDVPKYNHQSVRDVTSITGPNGPHYLFLTHVDDTADHEKWAQHFNSNKPITGNDESRLPSTQYCQRIFHAGDLGRYNWIGDSSLEQVPILIPIHPSLTSLTKNPITGSKIGGLIAYTLNGMCISDDNDDWLKQFEAGKLHTDVIILHTPGHSPGSCSLYKRRRTISSSVLNQTTRNIENTTITSIPGVLFTGDTYAYSGKMHKMTGFPRYGRDLNQLRETLTQLITTTNAWDVIAPGHALPRDYRNVSRTVRLQELLEAQNDLVYR